MQITFELNDEKLDEEKQEIIKKVLKINDGQVQDSLTKVCQASLDEYLAMFLEGGMPNRADEAKQDRLMFLIESYFENELPTESQISTIFQLTQSQSKTLLKNTVSRFRHNLNNALENTMRAVLQNSEQSDHKYLAVISSDVIKDELNMLITQNEPTFKPIMKRKGSAGQYEISEDSYSLLCEQLGI